MRALVLIAAVVSTGTLCFAADRLSSVTWEGQQIKDISDVRITASGKIIVIHPSGGFSTTEDKLPSAFLESWGITPEKLQTAKSARAKSAEDDFERALRAGLFREVGGVVYDLRKTQPDWTYFASAKVLQVLEDGAIVNVARNGEPVTGILIRNLSKTLSDTDTVSFTARLTGSYSFINKLGDDRTIRAYDAGRPCQRDEIPEAITKENKLWGKVVGGGAAHDVLARLPEREDISASGTGFFISDDGFLLTNFHVIEDAKKIKVKTKAGVFQAEIVKRDRSKDLALLKVAGQFSALPIADAEALPLGEPVFTIGFPNVQLQGLEPKYTDGKISSLTGIQDDPSEYQISVPVQPGNSGGPLMDQTGQVAGVIVARLNDLKVLRSLGSLPQNVNYAIKSTVIREFLKNVPGMHSPVPPASKSIEAVARTEKAIAMILVY